MAMFVGALIGRLLIFHVSIVYPLVSAFIILASVSVKPRHDLLNRYLSYLLD
jgi:hypothetical protein